MSDQGHPYADHPAAAVLADHRWACFSLADPTCYCGWDGESEDHPAHQADALDQAGLLAAGTPPETPTTRVRAERADRRTT